MVVGGAPIRGAVISSVPSASATASKTISAGHGERGVPCRRARACVTTSSASPTRSSRRRPTGGGRRCGRTAGRRAPRGSRRRCESATWTVESGASASAATCRIQAPAAIAMPIANHFEREQRAGAGQRAPQLDRRRAAGAAVLAQEAQLRDGGAYQRQRDPKLQLRPTLLEPRPRTLGEKPPSGAGRGHRPGGQRRRAALVVPTTFSRSPRPRGRGTAAPPDRYPARIASDVATAELETPAVARARPSTVRLVIVLGSVNAIGPLSIDMYLPAFPEIARELDASASQVQLTLTACVAGLALGQLVIGPLSDRLGRRRPLIAAMRTYAVASLLCALAPSVPVLIGLRLRAGAGGRGRRRDRARRRPRPALGRGRGAAVLVADAGHRAGADPRAAGRRAGARASRRGAGSSSCWRCSRR